MQLWRKTVLDVFRVKRYIRLMLFLFTIFFFAISFALLAGLTIFDRQHNHIIHDYVARNDDIIILSTTYYETSKSYEPNTVVVLFNAVQVFHLKYSYLEAVVETVDKVHTVRLRIEPVIKQLPFFCKWVPYTATAQIPSEHTLMKLSSNGGNSGIELAMRQPYQTLRHRAKQAAVVSCFSPLFLNERWQLLLATVEIYSHYGAFLHFYIRSMITDLFRLIKSNRNVRITPWPAVKLGKKRAASSDFDPNMELEFRNQASAMTDCLLMYKEAADYVIFPDIDDIIIPSIGPSYSAEFQKMFEMYPNAGAIIYNMTQTIIESTTYTSKYSPLDLISSIQFEGEQRWGKLVVRPERVDSTWIHRSYGVRDGYEQLSVPISMNAGLHFRNWRFNEITHNRTARSVPFYDPMNNKTTTRSLFTATDGKRIEKNFMKKLRNKTNLRSFLNLPSVSLYYPLIEECYNRIFYHASDMGTACRGPEYCNIPPFPGLKCTNVVSEFVSYDDYTNLFVHQFISSEFTDSMDGCRL